MILNTKHMSKNHKQNTWAKYPWENAPGKCIEDEVYNDIHQIKSDYLQIISGLT